MNNEIPKEVISDWELAAMERVDTPYMQSYIQGRTDQYLEDRKLDNENKLLHECITELYNYDINVPRIKQLLMQLKEPIKTT